MAAILSQPQLVKWLEQSANPKAWSSSLPKGETFSAAKFSKFSQEYPFVGSKMNAVTNADISNINFTNKICIHLII